MAVIKINELTVDLERNLETYVLQLGSRVYINTESISDEILKKILFMGFPGEARNKAITNIKLSEILETKHVIKSNNATCFLYKLLKEVHKYDYFVLFAVGLDPQGVNFLYRLPQLFNEINKKVFIIDQERYSIDFDFGN